MKPPRDIDTSLAWLPALVLIVVASAYLWRWQHEPLSSWRGGGMGMYADINDEAGHYLRAYVLRDQWERVQIDDRFVARETQTRLNPSPAAVTALADSLACDAVFRLQYPELRQLRLEYWERTFDKATSQVHLAKRFEVNREPCAVD